MGADELPRRPSQDRPRESLDLLARGRDCTVERERGSTVIPDKVEISGPHFKPSDRYLSSDGDNPLVPWPGYGWPLGSTCWYFRLTGEGRWLYATGHTVEQALARAVDIATGPVFQ